MAFINSNDIYAFPVATRGASYPLSRLTTEQNLVNIIKSVTDITTTSGFVVTGASSKDINSSDSMEFIVGGYYFKTAMNTLPTGATDGQVLYACVNISTSGAAPVATANQEIVAQQNTSPSNDKEYNSGDYTWVGAGVTANTQHPIASGELLTITDRGVSTSYGYGGEFKPTFNISAGSVETPTTGSIGLGENIIVSSDGYDMDQISDGVSEFVGVSFLWSSIKPDDYTYCIPILHYKDSAYYVEEEYRYKLNQNSIDNSWIDMSNQS